MPRLHVQIIGPDERLHSAETVDCSCSAAETWSYVAAQARRLGNAVGMRIQLHDANGGLVLRTGVAAALLAEENGKKPKRQAERQFIKGAPRDETKSVAE